MDERRAVRARVIDERDYGEIARSLGCSEMVIRKRVVPRGDYYMMGNNRGNSDDSGTGDPSRRPGSSGARLSPTGR